MATGIEFRDVYVAVDFFREEDLDKSSRRIRDELRKKNRRVFLADLAKFPDNAAAKLAGLVPGQMFVDNSGVPHEIT